MIKMGHWKEVEPEQMMEGVRVRWVIGKNLNPPNFYFRVFELDPAASTPYHSHPWEHESFILEGKAGIKFPDGSIREAEPGTYIFIPPNEKHQFINLGEGTLRFICVIPKHD